MFGVRFTPDVSGVTVGVTLKPQPEPFEVSGRRSKHLQLNTVTQSISLVFMVIYYFKVIGYSKYKSSSKNRVLCNSNIAEPVKQGVCVKHPNGDHDRTALRAEALTDLKRV